MTEYSGSGDLELSLRLLWGRREPRSRGPKPGLDVEAIVSTAIRIADTDGLAGLSMRRIAQELGVGTMSLYRYVRGKSELLTVMLDRVLDEDAAAGPPAGAGWREALAGFAHGYRALLERHPWLLQVSEARPTLGPNGLAGTERLLAALDGSGLGEPEKLHAITAVSNYTQGATRILVEASQAAARTGVSDEQFWAAQTPFLREFLARGDHPHLSRAMDAGVWDGPDTGFEFGLECLLDGIERRAAAARGH
jgi:AcrR family transcriptional regulator